MAQAPGRDVLTGFSKALFSTWFYYHPWRLLLDAGEGVAATLAGKSFAIRHVLISHGHNDHISGLISLLWSRAVGSSDRRPVTVYYPTGNQRVEQLRDYVTGLCAEYDSPVEWIGVKAGQEVGLAGAKEGARLQTFSVAHTPEEIGLGYNLVESRYRLKEEFSHLDEGALAELSRKKGRETLREPYQVRILSYGGDSLALNPKDVAGTEFLLHEATFLNDEDRAEFPHATLGEALQVAAQAEAKAVGIFHISARYHRDEVISAAEKLMKKWDPGRDTYVILGEDWVQI